MDALQSVPGKGSPVTVDCKGLLCITSSPAAYYYGTLKVAPRSQLLLWKCGQYENVFGSLQGYKLCSASDKQKSILGARK